MARLSQRWNWYGALAPPIHRSLRCSRLSPRNPSSTASMAQVRPVLLSTSSACRKRTFHFEISFLSNLSKDNVFNKLKCIFLKVLELTFPNVSSNSLLFIRVLIVKKNFHKAARVHNQRLPRVLSRIAATGAQRRTRTPTARRSTSSSASSKRCGASLRRRA